MAKGKAGKSSGVWKGGPARRNANVQAAQPRNPKQTRDTTGNPGRNRRDEVERGGGRDEADGGRDGRPDSRPGNRPGHPQSPQPPQGGGFARAGRSQTSKPTSAQRIARPERGDGANPRGGNREEGQKPWANRPAADRRAARADQEVERENTSRTAAPLAPRRTERSELRPQRGELSGRPMILPRTPAPIREDREGREGREGRGGPTPLEQRRAYRYGGEVAVDRDLLYGRNAVAEALRAGRRKVRLVFVAEGTEGGRPVSEIEALAAERSMEVRRVARMELERRAPGVNHQGVVAEVGPYVYVDYAEMLDTVRDNPDALLLVLDSLHDPQNFGTLLRTAEAAGVTGVVIPDHRAVGVTPAVVNASAGAVEYLPVASVTNLVQAVERAKEAGAWAVAAEGVPEATAAGDADLTGPLVLVVGSEGQGVSRLLRETCDLTVRIPLAGRVGSLNAATAGSILLYEVVRQRAEDSAYSAAIAAEAGEES